MFRTGLGPHLHCAGHVRAHGQRSVSIEILLDRTGRNTFTGRDPLHRRNAAGAKAADRCAGQARMRHLRKRVEQNGIHLERARAEESGLHSLQSVTGKRAQQSGPQRHEPTNRPSLTNRHYKTTRHSHPKHKTTPKTPAIPQHFTPLP